MDRAQRKAKGVFYTPQWLVEDMLEQALRLARSSFGDGPLSVLDPACGDGAFLRQVPAYHRRFGVDLDRDALALLPTEAVGVHGDAIIDDPTVSPHALCWPEAFPAVFAKGGFHVVVGNPPYRNVDTPQAGDDPAAHAAFKRYLRTPKNTPGRLEWANHYRRMCDLYHLFFVRALWALRPGGVLAFVTSRTWLEGWYADQLRGFLLEQSTVIRIVDYGSRVLFEGTDIPACVVLLQKRPAPADHGVDVIVGSEQYTVAQATLGRDPWRFRAESIGQGVRLGDVCDLSQGMQTGCNAVFANFKTADIERLGLEAQTLRRRATGRDIQAGALLDEKVRWALWTDETAESDLPPRVSAWLRTHRGRLEARAAFRRGDCDWFRWSWPRKHLLDRPKILCPYRARSNRFWFDAAGDVIALTDVTLLLPRADCPVSPQQLTRTLNDAEHTRRAQAFFKQTGHGLLEYFAGPLAELPMSF